MVTVHSMAYFSVMSALISIGVRAALPLYAFTESGRRVERAFDLAFFLRVTLILLYGAIFFEWVAIARLEDWIDRAGYLSGVASILALIFIGVAIDAYCDAATIDLELGEA